MDGVERKTTQFLLELVKAGVITFAGCAAGEFVLGPAGVVLGPIAAAFAARNSKMPQTWSEMRAEKSYAGLMALVLKIAAKLLIENWGILVELAKSIAGFIEKLFSKHKALPMK